MKLYKANYSANDDPCYLGKFLGIDGDYVLYKNKGGVIIREHRSFVCFNGVNFSHPEADIGI